MTALGPVVPVQIEIPIVLAQKLGAAGQPVPTPFVGNAMVDTGAGITCVDRSVAVALGLQPVGTTHLAGAVGQGPRNLYAVRIVLWGGQLNVDATGAAEADLGAFGIHALLGRDVLDKMLFIYDGTQGEFTLSY